MNKKLLKLLDDINAKKQEVRDLADQGKIEDAGKAKKELQELQQKFDLLKDIEDEALDNARNQLEETGSVPGKEPVDPEPKDSIKAFADAARARFRNAMTEGSSPDGGYTVPEDIQTRIEEYRGVKASLIDLVDVEAVSTNKGARTFKMRSQQTGFTKVGEGNAIPGKGTPQFERLEYEIAKYAGYFPVTNELLEDSDANISNTLIAWIGDESRVTRNNLILEALATKEATALEGLDDIKYALNVTLGQAFKPTSRIVTNDDGLQYLDTLKDANGRDLLQPDPTSPAKIVLRSGATVVPITVIPNADMPSDTSTAGTTVIPMIIGDLKEAVKFFDRKQLTIMTSNIASVGDFNAFEQDMTLFRAIEREDVKIKDSEAYVYGQLTVTEETTEDEDAA
ncbi:MAG: phage major capsid protein [Lachnospiraceae bacterium]|nr:phage major capsid protein [Lachnospiraceae bacterium]